MYPNGEAISGATSMHNLGKFRFCENYFYRWQLI